MAVRRVAAAFTLISWLGIQVCLAADVAGLTRGSFPDGFVFGTASSAFQYEGAVKEDGRGPSTWDKFSHTFGKVIDFSNADIAVDQYHRYKEDVQLMADIGLDAYRFSISWSRLLPTGSGEVNRAGVDYYNNLINELLAKGIQPYVTLFHWDLPLALEDNYKGFLDRQIILSAINLRPQGQNQQGASSEYTCGGCIRGKNHSQGVFDSSRKDFAYYAEICFKEFGDRVKHWITFNEPHTFSVQGYDVGLQAPGKCSVLLHLLCRGGNSAIEPYVVAHNILLSHAAVSDIYKQKYKSTQHGSIGASFDVIWFEPMSNSTEDKEAAGRAQDFQLGWFMEPLFFGEYPSSMRLRVGNRLPRFSASEAALVKGSLDFVGINHYTTFYAKSNSTNILGILLNDTVADSGAVTLPFNLYNLKPIGDKAASVWIYIVPQGMRSVMNYIKNKYGRPPVFITENGMDDSNNPFISIKEALKDSKRIKYHNDYLMNLAASIREDGCDVRGYFAWSLLDNWEWAAGYTSRFGLYFIDYKDKLKRYPKDSVKWFKAMLNSSG